MLPSHIGLIGLAVSLLVVILGSLSHWLRASNPTTVRKLMAMFLLVFAGAWSDAGAQVRAGVIPNSINPNAGSGVVTPSSDNVLVSANATHSYTFAITDTSSYTANGVALSISSCTGAVSSCSVSPTSVSIGAGYYSYVTVTYYAGASGTGSVTLKAHWPSQLNTYGTLNVTLPTATPAVTVSPNPQYAVESFATNDPYFSITNNGNSASTYALSASCSGNIITNTCSVSSPSASVSPGGSTGATVYYTTGAFTGGNATATLTATSTLTGESSSTSVTVVPLSSAVSVTPDGGTATANPATNPSAAFTVTDVGNSSPSTYSLSCGYSGAVTGCSVTPGVQVYIGSPQTVSVSYTTASNPAGGTGTVTLTASDATGVHTYTDGGSYTVTVPDTRTYTVGVTPDATTSYSEQSVATNFSFTVANSGNATANYTLTIPTCTGTASGCSFSSTSSVTTTTVSVGNGANTSVPVYFTTGPIGQNAAITVHAAGSSNGDDGSVTIVTLAPTVVVSPVASSQNAQTNASGSYTFNVHNVGSSGQITYTLQVTGCTAPLTSCTAPASVTVAQNADSVVSVAFQTQTASGAGQISLRAYKSFVNTYESTGTGTVNVISRLSVSTAFMNNDDQDMSLCAASCFAMTASRSTVPYYTLDTPRSVTLIYNGDRAFPRPFIYADVSVTSAPASIQNYTLEVKRDGVNLPFTNGETKLTFAGTSSPTTTYRLAGQIDMSSYQTSVDSVTVLVTAIYTNGQSDVTPVKAQLMIVNTHSSPIANGWGIAGLQRLNYAPEGGTGGQGYMIENGDGSATYFTSGNTTGADLSNLSLNGQVWTRTYVDSSRVLFDASGRMTTAIDRLGRQTQFQYGGSDGFHLLSIMEPMRTSGSSPAAPYLSLAYDGSGRLASVTETGGAGNRTTGVSVDGNGYLTRVTDPDGGYDSYGYDTSGRLHTITDRRGNATTYNYDRTWQLSQVESPAVPIDAGGGTTTTGTPTVTLAPWQSVRVPLDSTTNNPAPLILPSDLFDRLISPSSDTTTFVPDRWGQVLQTTDPLGHVTTIERSGFLPMVVHHIDGSADSATYSAGVLLSSLRRAGQSTVHILYGSFGQADSTWGGGSAAQRIFLNTTDGNVDSVRHAGPTPNVILYTYDTLGRLISVRDEAGHMTHYGYDPVWGNVDSVTNAVGKTVRTTFDLHGRTAAYINGVDSAVTFAYDSLNRQIAVARGISGVPVQTVFDGLLPTTVIDRNSNHTVTDYNALGWPTDRCDPAGHCTYYRYDLSGRLTSETNRRGQRVDRSYDRLGRLLVKSGDSTSTDNFAYSADGRGATAWNSIETDSVRVRPGTSVLGAADTTVTIVNSTRFQVIHGDLSSWAGEDSTVITTSTPSVTFRKRYRYADTTTGLVTSYNDGFSTMTYSYTGDWLQSSTTNVSGTKNTSFLPSHAPVWTMFSAGGLTSLNRSQGYDGLLRLSNVSTFVTGGPFNGSTFAYDSAGRLAETQLLTGCTGTTTDSTYGWSHSNCSGQSVPIVYSYDNEGNRTSQGGTYDTGNRVLTNNSFAYTHDLDGNIIRQYNASTGEDHQYTWSSDGRLTDVSYKASLWDTASTVHYDYNAHGQPVLRSVGFPNRVWVYDRGQLLGEFYAGQRVAEYVYNEDVDEPYGVILGATTPTAIHYFRLDERGNVLGAYDESSVTMSVAYDDWGVPSITSGTQIGNLMWKGLHRDEYTGLYYARARWYDPTLGRFLSEDPAGLAGGVNPYTFADNDPINGSDPSGLFSGGIFGRIGSTICGKVCEFIGDFFHAGPSKVPHAPQLRGANPGCPAGPPGQRPASGWVTSPFGIRTHPFSGKQTMHQGTDIAGPEGSYAYPMYPGVVTRVGAVSRGGNGVYVGDFNGYTNKYFDLANILVDSGDTVWLATPIATLAGKIPGISTGAHIHVELRTPARVLVDPMSCMP